jgi:hypothetical protein
MNQATPGMRNLARELIVNEPLTNESSAFQTREVFCSTERLRPHLVNLMGKGGYRALLARALVQTSAEVPWLDAVTVDADGNLKGLAVLHSRIDPAEFLEGNVVVLAQLLGLLIALIGPDLSARLMGEIWPKMRSAISVGVLADSGEQNEKAN